MARKDILKNKIRELNKWEKYQRYTSFGSKKEAEKMAKYLMPTHTQKGLIYSDFSIRKEKINKTALRKWYPKLNPNKVKKTYSIWFKNTGN